MLLKVIYISNIYFDIGPRSCVTDLSAITLLPRWEGTTFACKKRMYSLRAENVDMGSCEFYAQWIEFTLFFTFNLQKKFESFAAKVKTLQVWTTNSKKKIHAHGATSEQSEKIFATVRIAYAENAFLRGIKRTRYIVMIVKPNSVNLASSARRNPGNRTISAVTQQACGVYAILAKKSITSPAKFARKRIGISAQTCVEGARLPKNKSGFRKVRTTLKRSGNFTKASFLNPNP